MSKGGKEPGKVPGCRRKNRCQELRAVNVGKLGSELGHCDVRVCTVILKCCSLLERFRAKLEELKVTTSTSKRMYLVII